jgi:hypothetical protein
MVDEDGLICNEHKIELAGGAETGIARGGGRGFPQSTQSPVRSGPWSLVSAKKE